MNREPMRYMLPADFEIERERRNAAAFEQGERVDSLLRRYGLTSICAVLALVAMGVL